jgi:hypothetical protein
MSVTHGRSSLKSKDKMLDPRLLKIFPRVYRIISKIQLMMLQPRISNNLFNVFAGRLHAVHDHQAENTVLDAA